MKNRPSILFFLIAAVAIFSCTQRSRQADDAIPLSGGFVCTENFVAGLIVEVRDAVTGEPAAYGSVGVIRDGTYSETLQIEGGAAVDPSAALRLVGAWERAGFYSVLVRKDGYRDWSATAVVEADNCHVHTVTLQAMLEPMG